MKVAPAKNKELIVEWYNIDTSNLSSLLPLPLLGGLAIVETVLWDAVPSYLRKLNAQTIESLSKPIPLTLVPIQFSSWMGGTYHICLCLPVSACVCLCLPIFHVNDRLFINLTACICRTYCCIGLSSFFSFPSLCHSLSLIPL
jgi:hypothetical protein